jgi:hypothetical protein
VRRWCAHSAARRGAQARSVQADLGLARFRARRAVDAWAARTRATRTRAALGASVGRFQRVRALGAAVRFWASATRARQLQLWAEAVVRVRTVRRAATAAVARWRAEARRRTVLARAHAALTHAAVRSALATWAWVAASGAATDARAAAFERMFGDGARAWDGARRRRCVGTRARVWAAWRSVVARRARELDAVATLAVSAAVRVVRAWRAAAWARWRQRRVLRAWRAATLAARAAAAWSGLRE